MIPEREEARSGDLETGESGSREQISRTVLEEEEERNWERRGRVVERAKKKGGGKGAGGRARELATVGSPPRKGPATRRGRNSRRARASETDRREILAKVRGSGRSRGRGSSSGSGSARASGHGYDGASAARCSWRGLHNEEGKKKREREDSRVRGREYRRGCP